MPFIPKEFIEMVSDRYIELYEKITGEEFVKETSDDIYNRIETNINNYLLHNLVKD